MNGETHSYNPNYENSWALVIGINEYLYARPQLEFACNDAQSVADVLCKELGFPKANVAILVDKDATRQKILKRFLAYESVSSDDRLFVFFAGHGITVPGKRGPVGYLVPVDGRYEDKSTLIRWDELTRGAELIPAKHILFVVDACYGGLAIQRASSSGEKRFVKDMLRRYARQVITAGKADQTVADGGGTTGKNSIFTGYLLEGLRGKAKRNGVLTASYLMNYVYQNVADDERSHQTPHFGHIDGDGDFILTTPHVEDLTDDASDAMLVEAIEERPESVQTASEVVVRPHLADKIGYSDPGSDSFGQNEWTRKLEGHEWKPRAGADNEKWFGHLSLIIEPVSDVQINLDLSGLARSLPNRQPQAGEPYERFVMPHRVITTSKSVILYDSYEPYYSDKRSDMSWSRFLRIDRNGTIEYSESEAVARTYTRDDGAMMKAFRFVPIVALVWSFLYAAKRILSDAGYHARVRLLVNMISTKDTLLVDFAKSPGKDGQHWAEPFSFDGIFFGSLGKWRCSDANLQFPFEFALGTFRDTDANKLIHECAEMLGLAYNHQSAPRCFIYGTDEFPWGEVRMPF